LLQPDYLPRVEVRELVALRPARLQLELHRLVDLELLELQSPLVVVLEVVGVGVVSLSLPDEVLQQQLHLLLVVD
jgi:hypothetical protein